MAIEPAGINDYFTVGSSAGNYQELQYPDPSFQIIQGNPLKVRKRYILYSPTYSQLWEFQNRILGWSYVVVDGGNKVLRRALPQKLDVSEVPTFAPSPGLTFGVSEYKPAYWATQILSAIPIDPKKYLDAALGSNPPPDPYEAPTLEFSAFQYGDWAIEVLFEQPMYDILPIEETTSEYYRYCFIRETNADEAFVIRSNTQSIKYDTSVDPISIDGTAYPGKNVSNSGISTDVLWREDRRIVTVDWYDLPNNGFYRQRLREWRNSMNSATALFNYNSKELLYIGFQERKRRHQLGYYCYDVQLMFDYVGTGHDRLLNKYLLYQKVVRESGPPVGGVAPTGDLYPSRNFDSLFVAAP